MLTRSETLGPHTTLGLGGVVSHFFEAESESEILEGVRFARSARLPLLPLGGGSNVVVRDADFRAFVLKVRNRGVRFEAGPSFTRVTAAAGENWHDFVARVVHEDLAGLECLGGIPGCVGATPIQNVGAYGQEVSETIESVRVLDLETLEERTFGASDLGFSYRNSRFKSAEPNRYLILEVTFRLLRGGPPKLAYAELKNALSGSSRPTLREVFETVLELRSAKSMYLGRPDENSRSCGSFFVNAIATEAEIAAIERAASEQPPTHPLPDGRAKVPSAWLIERAGFPKGTRRGSVGLSTKHTLALVALEGATTESLLAFAEEIVGAVHARFGLLLEREPILWPIAEPQVEAVPE